MKANPTSPNAVPWTEIDNSKNLANAPIPHDTNAGVDDEACIFTALGNSVATTEVTVTSENGRPTAETAEKEDNY